METTNWTAADHLNPAEQQAIANINKALDFDANPGLWADCGEVDVPVLVQAVERLSEEVCKLDAFKTYVHNRLDAAGIDKHKEQNALNGCRIGARLTDVLSAATPVGGDVADRWVKCDGEADYQAEEVWVWVVQNGKVVHGIWKEAYWEEDEVTGRPLDDHFVWAEAQDEDSYQTMNPQPTHFQPKPTAPLAVKEESNA
jgi:hypothetical protein